ncbi:hypothetical protein [Streptomyces yaizuensis]|uniref:Uncharacterized protein n=1 Tax=Streptomyces yaizuensis TaxID=2989713 RepID=A0ABQ5NQK4_9ACTN|nr:hypothetical protein [Streptomyces sp. YSPA8]GLF92629.1 hypothetical protein SYYSPA8_00050 [Streptomyces sp. YSPA8]
MGWKSDAFGSSHEGRAGAVLADGSEPKPVYFDSVSGGSGHTSSDWWVYDGTLGAPLAPFVRGACSCGWRGVPRHPVNWAEVEEDGPYGFDTSGPQDDWWLHIDEVEARSVPLPTGLADLLEQLGEQLHTLAGDAPLAALRAAATLERTLRETGRTAALLVEADANSGEVSWESIGTALGLTREDARSRVWHYTSARP